VAISRPCYCSRDALKRAADFKESARNNAQLDRAIEAGSDTIDGGALGGNRGAGLLKRRFYPETAVKTFDWPDPQGSRPHRLWLRQHEVASVSQLIAGGVEIPASDYFLRPDNPPHDLIEIDLSSSAAFSSGDTHQRAVSVAGEWNFPTTTAAAGTLAEALDASETGVDVSDSAAIGVGDLIVAGSERMLVTGKSMLTTGQTLQADLTANNAAKTVAVTTGSAYTVDEIVLLDSERMLVVDIAGNNLTVERAFDGTVLATHSGSTIYAPRTLTVVRGATGSTAATHDSGDAVSRIVYPPLVRDLALALALNEVLQEGSGYARTAGSGESEREVGGRGLAVLIKQAKQANGRKARKAAV
jgi:hypothetical protein